MTGVTAADERCELEYSCTSQRACVTRISEIAPGVKQFELHGVAGSRLSSFSAGAHVVITMRDKEDVWRKPYSIMAATADGDGYVISVRNSSKSRGGSWFLHTRVCVGFELDISHPINNFSVASTARRHILIAGGMGITPMLAMLDELQRDKANVELHHAVRSETEGGYVSKLSSDVARVIQIYSSDRGERLPLDSILGERSTGSHVYVCGPQRMIDAVLDAARRFGWPKETVHYENAVSHEVPIAGPAHVTEGTGAFSAMLEAYLMKMRELAEPPVRENSARRALNSSLRKAAKPIPAGYFAK